MDDMDSDSIISLIEFMQMAENNNYSIQPDRNERDESITYY